MHVLAYHRHVAGNPGAFSGPTEEDLGITSHELREYFRKHKIVPWQHPRYKDFFCAEEPDVALTYEWSTPFVRIREFLNRTNIRAHNRASRDLNPSPWERLYWMSFAWVLLGPLAKLPEDIDNKTMWIDILFNDQNSVNMAEELKEAENRRLHASIGIEIHALT